VETLDKTPCESVVLLAWSVVVSKSAVAPNLSHLRIEKLILKLGTFEYLHNMLSFGGLLQEYSEHLTCILHR
jgi:hypothetical protein